MPRLENHTSFETCPVLRLGTTHGSVHVRRRTEAEEQEQLAISAFGCEGHSYHKQQLTPGILQFCVREDAQETVSFTGREPKPTVVVTTSAA